MECLAGLTKKRPSGQEEAMRLVLVVCFFATMLWSQKIENNAGIENISIIQYPAKNLSGVHIQNFLLPKNISCILTAEIISAEEPFLRVVLVAGGVSTARFGDFIVVEIQQKNFFGMQEYQIKKRGGNKKILKKCMWAPYQPSTEMLGEGWKVMRGIK